MYFYQNNRIVMKNLTDFHKTVETGMNPHLIKSNLINTETVGTREIVHTKNKGVSNQVD